MAQHCKVRLDLEPQVAVISLNIWHSNGCEIYRLNKGLYND